MCGIHELGHDVRGTGGGIDRVQDNPVPFCGRGITRDFEEAESKFVAESEEDVRGQVDLGILRGLEDREGEAVQRIRATFLDPLTDFLGSLEQPIQSSSTLGVSGETLRSVEEILLDEAVEARRISDWDPSTRSRLLLRSPTNCT